MKKIFWIFFIIFLTACDGTPWNDPYPKKDAKANTFYATFSERPKTLDPAQAYSSDEYLFIAQIYEPPLQYHYLKRPYTLIPASASALPDLQYYDAQDKLLPNDVAPEKVAYSVYTIHIAPQQHYQPHPAFVKDEKGNYLYRWYDDEYLDQHQIRTIEGFTQTATRELIADDYVYQIKRLADPTVNSPILGVMNEHIVGLKDYANTLKTVYGKIPITQKTSTFVDLRDYPLSGVKIVDRYTYQIKIKGNYPQFIYWLAMPFFAPIPWEADLFYSQPEMEDHNITWDWYPVGTGPFMLTQNNPNRRMVLVHNPNFHREYYPTSGEAEDLKNGLLRGAGKLLPFIDKAIFSLEKESVPRWGKFLQGYYDLSGVTADSFDQAILVNRFGEPQLTPELKKQNIHLNTEVATSIYYLGFNMLDDVIGGNSERARKLRLAISIALNYEEYIALFLNGRGIPAQDLLPPDVFGHLSGEKGINPYVYRWENGVARRRSLKEAKQLLAEAGYPDGRDEKTGTPLILHYDVPASTGPEDKSQLDWMRKQFAKLGIQLNIIATQYNRFQEKIRTGDTQIFSWGWNADYPDPENFLFLLYSSNGKVKFQGENAANYNNSEYDTLFERMRNLPNTPERLEIIQKMLAIARHDAPWIWGFYPKTFTLTQSWISLLKPNTLANNTLKYLQIDPILRAEKRREWNQPIVWPIYTAIILVIISFIPVVWHHRKGKK